MIKNTYIQSVYILLLLLLFASCKKTNWRENYREKEKSPFGTYIISEEATSLFPRERITFLDENIYDYLLFNAAEDSTVTKNYILIKHSAYKQTRETAQELLNFVKQGNTAFIALNYFQENFKEALEFTTNNLDEEVWSIPKLKELKGEFNLVHPDFENTSYTFDRNIQRNYFLQYSNTKTQVLGTTTVGGEKVPNFIKIYHGKGAFYLHTNPIVFTNYYMLNGKETYAANLLSYLPSQEVLWDVHIKSSKFSSEQTKQPSIFKFFLQHTTLTWFLFVSLAGLLLFMLFNARRKQRPIPEIPPLKNTTVAFTQTIANLYLNENDHKNLVDKKIAYFLEKVRTKYLINTSNLNTEFIEKLAAKSGNELQNTKYLINTIIALNKKIECSEEELIGLHKMIENFFNK
ncbi:hypothetical protein FDT66_04470 [Polaribacter aestuariivivens]|uniref:DUF4350 domain-containing protein n=1 Tax=Polaribacter aestuariivivens TaxID=2304626 RepID=A0A5S3N7E2_9FLAO|nr:DUF4350 domain-containing protein [Polaribacter aestuariivivens]TMM31230.1 hypothetical protein FDT66_04470 [Polaribacter aestuariivivens]